MALAAVSICFHKTCFSTGCLKTRLRTALQAQKAHIPKVSNNTRAALALLLLPCVLDSAPSNLRICKAEHQL